MKNWKTTLFGILFATFTLSKPILTEKRAPSLEEIFQAGAAIGLGASAKDHNMTGAGDTAFRK